MPCFLIESYLASDPAARADALARARRAAQLAVGISYLRTTYVPEDETCLHLFEAPSVVVISRAAAVVGLSHMRIVEAVDTAATAGTGIADNDIGGTDG